jgi:hypothetical protein
VRLHEQYHDRGLEIIGVALDMEPEATVSEFASSFIMRSQSLRSTSANTGRSSNTDNIHSGQARPYR